MLVLLDRAGKLLDGLECSNNTAAILRTDVLDTPADDGARVIIRRTTLAGSLEEHDLIFVFQSWRENRDRDLPVDWKRRGICRVDITGDRLRVLTPRMTPILYQWLALWAEAFAEVGFGG
jgi:hypothetical protein